MFRRTVAHTPIRGVRALLCLAAGALGVDAQHGFERRGQQRGDLRQPFSSAASGPLLTWVSGSSGPPSHRIRVERVLVRGEGAKPVDTFPVGWLTTPFDFTFGAP